jgi:hypothetical protein
MALSNSELAWVRRKARSPEGKHYLSRSLIVLAVRSLNPPQQWREIPEAQGRDPWFERSFKSALKREAGGVRQRGVVYEGA